MKFAVGTKCCWEKKRRGCHVVVVLLLENEEASPASMILGIVNNFILFYHTYPSKVGIISLKSINQ